MLYDGKTEVLIIGSHQQLAKVNIDNIQVGAWEIKPAGSIHNLGIWFDSLMRMNTHVCKVYSKAFFGLYKIREIRKCLTEESTSTSNSLLFGIIQHHATRLRKVLDAAPCLTCHILRYEHIMPILKDLHWLPIIYCICFMIALLLLKVVLRPKKKLFFLWISKLC